MKYKKCISLFFLAAILTANVASAQIFVGGSMGFDYWNGKDSFKGEKQSTGSEFEFKIAPRAGYYLNDDLAVGLEIGIAFYTNNIPEGNRWKNSVIRDGGKVNIVRWNVGTFARYNLFGTEKFSMLLEGGIGIGGEKEKLTVGSTINEGAYVFKFNIGILPVLSYNLSDRFSIEASTDFLRLGFQSLTVTDDKGTEDEGKWTNNYFGLGVGSNSRVISYDFSSDALGLPELSLFRLGVVFKF